MLLKKNARVQLMKDLANKYINTCNRVKVKDCYYFNQYYKNKKMLFPWLGKEKFRWHVRNQMKKKQPSKTRQEKALLGNNCQVSCSNLFLNNIFSYIVFGGWGQVFIHFEQRSLRLRAPSPLR